MYRYYLTAVLIVVAIIVVASWGRLQTRQHADQIADVSARQMALATALARNWEQRPSAELVGLLGEAAAEDLLRDLSIDERNRLNPAACEWVTPMDLTRATRPMFTCSAYPEATQPSDIFCRTIFPADKGGFASPPFDMSALTGEGCLLTVWSRTGGAWKIRHVDTGLVVDEDKFVIQQLERMSTRYQDEATATRAARPPAGD